MSQTNGRTNSKRSCELQLYACTLAVQVDAGRHFPRFASLAGDGGLANNGVGASFSGNHPINHSPSLGALGGGEWPSRESLMPGQAEAIDSTIQVITPENIAFRYQLAGPTRRLGAFMIDLILRGAVIFGLFILFSFFQSNILFGIYLLICFIIWWGYGAIFETYWNGQTLGKRAFHIRSLSIDGRPITGMQAFIRTLLRDADMLPFLPSTVLPTGMVGLVVMSFDSKFQRLGDLVAGTVVVVEERHWLRGLETLEDPRVYQLASYIPTNFEISRSLSQTLALYVERRKIFGAARRREIAQPLCKPLLERFGLPADTSYDLLMCALYYRAFVGDIGDDEQYAEVAARALQAKQQPQAPPLSELFPST